MFYNSTEIEYTLVTTDDELHQILALQQVNLKNIKSKEEETEDGFVTVRHDFSLLKKMNAKSPHIVAKHHQTVIGYALAMTKEFMEEIPELKAMYSKLEYVNAEGKKLGQTSYIVMGQVCIDAAYRKQGIFRNLYKLFFEVYKPVYRMVITEVASRNQRSLLAHLSVGFEEIFRYLEPDSEEWIVIKYLQV